MSETKPTSVEIAFPWSDSGAYAIMKGGEGEIGWIVPDEKGRGHLRWKGQRSQTRPSKTYPTVAEAKMAVVKYWEVV